MNSTRLSNWNLLEDAFADRDYDIQEWLGETEGASFVRATHRPDGRRVLIKLLAEEGIDAERQLQLWNRVREFAHPHLLRLLDFGRSEDGEEPFLFAVFEFPDDTLAKALERNALSETEALEVREAISGALAYIHSHGLAHAAVDEAHILAVGNDIKLASDTLREPDGRNTVANDLAQLDALFPPPRRVPETAPAPVAVVEQARPEPIHAPTPQPARPPFPLWAYGALAALLGGLGYLFLPKTPPPPPATRAVSSSQTPTRPPATASAVAASPAQGRDYWRVIAFTYSSRKSAERRADAINKKWSGAKAEVFTPNPDRSPYLIALGGRMDRDEAVRLLKIARGKGFPRDIYIQNYSR